MKQIPLPNEVYEESMEFIHKSYELLGRLRILETCGCTLAGHQANRLEHVVESITEKLKEMAA